jgi:hypothetical protein
MVEGEGPIASRLAHEVTTSPPSRSRGGEEAPAPAAELAGRREQGGPAAIDRTSAEPVRAAGIIDSTPPRHRIRAEATAERIRIADPRTDRREEGAAVGVVGPPARLAGDLAPAQPLNEAFEQSVSRDDGPHFPPLRKGPPAPAGSAARHRRARIDGDERPQITVKIGRIELTPPAAEPAPAEVRRIEQPALGLDDYLRNRGRS